MSRRTGLWGMVAALLLLASMWAIPVVIAQGSTPTPRVPVLFQDDFGTYSGRWTLAESPKAEVLYQGGTLMMQIVSPGVDIWSVPDFTAALTNYRLEVEVVLDTDSPDALAGFVLDYQDDENFYALAVFLNGQWTAQRRVEGEWFDLMPEAEPAALSPDDDTLVLEAEVSDGTVTLWVDDQQVGEITLDDPLAGATFGLYARAGHGYLDAAFDNLIVTAVQGTDSQ